MLDAILAILISLSFIAFLLWSFFKGMEMPDPKWDREMSFIVAEMNEMIRLNDARLLQIQEQAHMLEQRACFDNDGVRIGRAQDLMVRAEDEFALRRSKVTRVQLLMEHSNVLFRETPDDL